VGRHLFGATGGLAGAVTRFVYVLAGGAVVALVAAGCGSDNPGALQDFPGTTRQQLLGERVSPAIQVVQTEYKATVSVPTFGVNGQALQDLARQVATQAINGQIARDDKSLRDAYTKGIAANPDAYLTATPPGDQANVTVDFQCTGSIVTPDGYIVTAAHCTNVPADERTDAYIKTGLQPLVDKQVKAFQDAAAAQGSFDADQQKQLATAVSTFLQEHEQVSNETSKLATALYAFSDTGQHQVATATLSLVTQGTAPPKSTGPFGDKDVSIVKMDGHNDLPTVPVTSDTGMEGGQQLFIDGYPGNFLGGSLDKESPTTVTAGPISSRKVSDSGVPLLETTATAAPGSSGSPGLDDAGRMVGVVSYGSGQYNYLVGGSVVQQYLREKNIQPRESTTTHLYDIALNDFHRQYYKRALQEFQQVKQLSGTHPYVDSFLQRTQEAIQAGSDRTPLIDGTALVLVVAAAAGLVVLVAAALTFLLVRLRRPRPSGAAAGPNMVWETPPASGAPTQVWAAPPAAPAGPAPPPAQPAAPIARPPAPAPQPAAAPPPPPIVSPDGLWVWDGQRWVPNAAPPGERPGAAPDNRDPGGYPPPPGYR
jgi:serine protease Do